MCLSLFCGVVCLVFVCKYGFLFGIVQGKPCVVWCGVLCCVVWCKVLHGRFLDIVVCFVVWCVMWYVMYM